MLVTLAVGLAIGAAALSLALSGRRSYEVDRVRVSVNRSLRAAGDFLVTDLHQAGERLSADFPAIEIVDGTAGGPDELVLRRNLLRAVLRVCSDTDDDDETIQVAWKPTHPLAPPPAGCAPLPDEDGDGWPDDIQTWKEHRENAGGVVKGYIYNPVTRVGEPFQYDSEASEAEAYELRRQTGTGEWLNDYTMAEQSRLYILEERRYRLVGGILELVIDGDAADPVRLVDRIVDFQVRADQAGVMRDSLAVGDPWYAWDDLDAVEISVDGSAPFRLRQLNRTWSTRVLPRNVLSL
jgi:type IV pilus assembly protein PilW